jgi:hypothetical protein
LNIIASSVSITITEKRGIKSKEAPPRKRKKMKKRGEKNFVLRVPPGVHGPMISYLVLCTYVFISFDC